MTIRAAAGAVLLLGASLLAAEPSSEPLPPAVAARSFTVAGDLEIDLVLAEPVIAQPVFLNFDERARMWVVEYRQYPHPAGLKVVSHDHFWRAVYDKVPPAPPNHLPGKDRISIHEDADGDGTFESHKVFLDGLNMVTAVEHGRGGVWVLNPPYLLFYADEDRDDLPDADPGMHLAGFGLEDTHAVANSLRWGPDGWLYGAHGSTVTAHVTRPGVKAPAVYIQGQCIWRYHPETRRFEVFAEGGGNAFGVEIDSKGRVFSGHNGGDTRGFHYMQGAYVRKGFEKHGPLSNPYAFGYFEPMPHHKVERFTHNFIIYDGAALPARYAGKLLGIEPLQGRVVLSEIVPEGSSFRTKDLDRPITTRDRWFRPVDIKAGPDGYIYLCDWYDRQIGHAGNMEGPFDSSTGRVYRLRPAGKKPVAPAPLGDLSSKQLIERLGDENKWVRQTALRLLADRRDAALTSQLEEKLERSAGQLALETFWALHLSGGLTEEVARKALDHDDPFVRLWCVRLLGDQSNLAPALAAKIVERAHSESDLEARSQLACSARRLPVKECLAVVRELAARDPDAADKRMPLLIWWALEAQVAAHSEEVLAMFESSSMWRLPLVENHLVERLMRRFAQAGTRRDLLACARLFDLSPGPEYSRKLMAGFEAAFSGRSLGGLPDQLVEAMARHNARSVALGLRQREPDAVEEALRTIANERAPAQKRLEYLSILREVPVPASVPVLLGIVESGGEKVVRKAALSALQLHDEPHVAGAVIAHFSRFDAELQHAALNLLANRAGSALQLAEAVRSGGIRAGAVSPNILHKMQLHHDEKLAQLIAQLWPATDLVSVAGLEQRMQKIAAVLRAGSGDPYQGQVLFDQQCGACHLLFGRGGQIGPDLTAFERTDVNRMLLSIVNPNAEIREGYEHLVVTTKDGRMLSGFMVDKDNQTMVLRGLDGQNTTLAHNDVAALKPAGLSLMPEGLLDPLDDRQVRDLFAYLRSTQPLVPKPNSSAAAK